MAIYLPYTQRQNELEENLLVVNSRIDPDKIIEVKNKLSKSVGVIQFEEELVLTNNGYNAISVNDIEIHHHYYNVYYGSLFGGLFYENERIDLPIVIDPGNSKTLHCKLGWIVNDSIFQFFNEKDLDLSFRQAERMLLQKGIDFDGNLVKYTEYAMDDSDDDCECSSMIEYIDGKVEKNTFLIQLTSSKGNKFTATSKSKTINFLDKERHSLP